MNDLETRLSDAGRALRGDAERTADVDAGWADLAARIAADGDGAVVVQATDRFDRPPASHHRWLAAAAAILVIVGAVGTFVALTDPAEQPTAAGGPLFVLPEAGSGYEVSNGYVQDVDVETDGAPPLFAREAVAFGVPEGDGYRDLAVVYLYEGTAPNETEAFGTAVERRTVQTARGEFVVTETSVFRKLTQQREGAWLAMDHLGAVPDDPPADRWVEESIALLSTIEIVDGSIVVDQPPGGLVEIARDHTAQFSAAASITYQVSGHGIVAGDDGSLATVDTVDWPISIVLLSAMTAAFVEPFTVDGREGWHVTRPGGWQGLVWRADGGQMVAVSGAEDLEALLRLAESLVPVDEATWRTATDAEGPVLTPATSEP